MLGDSIDSKRAFQAILSIWESRSIIYLGDIVGRRRKRTKSNRSAALEPAIRKFEEDHDHELDAMLALLRTVYKDSYVPQTNPANDFIVEILRKPGTDYAGIFLATALKSERSAAQILNAYLPEAKNQRIKSFAQKMSGEEGVEMADLRRALQNQ